MTQLCDHPMQIAMLRELMLEPFLTPRTDHLAGLAVAWLGDTPLANPKKARSYLAEMREADLVYCLADPESEKGLLWGFNRRASVQQRTGGIDPITITPEELLEAFSWRGKRRSFYDPNAWKEEGEGKSGTERAMIQCSSPWQYADRLRKL